ncbi:MAG: hypothetical protein ABII22_00915 [Candidatus Micrarchaeota archaeon]
MIAVNNRPSIIFLRSKKQSDSSVHFRDRLSYPTYTAIHRTPEEFEFLRGRISSIPDARIRVLQVGIGEDLVGETLSLLDMLHRTGKEYEITCLDPNTRVVFGHASQNEFELHADTLLSCGFDATNARRILGEMQIVRDVHEISEEPLDDGFHRLQMATFRFNILPGVLDRLAYVVGDISEDRLPGDMQGFHAIVCFHTLYHLEHDPRLIIEAVKNMASYLLKGGCLAIDSARFNVYGLLTSELVQEIGLKLVYDSNVHARHPLKENPRIYERI